ncbi:ImmA/IrrE family metallo-endopeptidase [Magnetospirillum sp. XM-1]|uniref:ImmA/IrrE family metallo-endopeptidase n=1 Tax=Magnetospirillum sp. XM-1 TaxID=1663591 RepID=UPI0009EBDF57|nr:ImmA/IrrE family metallo-endopeptidase [Magnetospirillum sp. XM-1]
MWLDPREEEIVKRHQQIYPVKVGALARDLGLTVREVDMSDEISGSLRSEEGKWVIRVNRRHAKVRQRFTVAHEIAHYLLHRDRIGLGLTDDTFYRSTQSDSVEREANRLAADILMPWHLVHKATAHGTRDPEALSQAFEVSEAAMSIRLGLPA